MASAQALSTPLSLHELYKYRIPDAGRIVAVALSPDGYRLCCATDRGVLILIDTRLGYFQVRLNAGSTTEITTLGWTSNTQVILGADDGDLYSISLYHSTMNHLPVVDISYLFQDTPSTIVSLACNALLKRLVLGHQDTVSIWGWSEHDKHEFFLLDRFSLTRDDTITAQTEYLTIQFLDPLAVKSRIFIGGDFGYLIWSDVGSVAYFWNTGARRVENSILHPLGGRLVVAISDNQIQIWPFSCGAYPFLNRLGEEGRDSIADHQGFKNLIPRTPLAVTSSESIVFFEKGKIVMVLPYKGKVSRFALDPDHTPRGVMSFQTRVYLALDGPDNSIVISALTMQHSEVSQVTGLRNANQQNLKKVSIADVDFAQLRARVQKGCLDCPSNSHLCNDRLGATQCHITIKAHGKCYLHVNSFICLALLLTITVVVRAGYRGDLMELTRLQGALAWLAPQFVTTVVLLVGQLTTNMAEMMCDFYGHMTEMICDFYAHWM